VGGNSKAKIIPTTRGKAMNVQEKIEMKLWNLFHFGKLQFVREYYWKVLHRLHPNYRYHVVKTGLKPDYYDPDIRIAAAILKEAHDYYSDYSWIESHEAPVISVLRRAFHVYENLKNLNTISLYETLQSEETNELLHDIINIKGAMWY
jgi:hypothetical protein